MATDSLLWQHAAEDLDPPTIRSLSFARTAKRDVASAALKTAEDKRVSAVKKRWRIKHDYNGETIIIRDVLESVIYWIKQFREFRDATDDDEEKRAALPWAAIRFVLQKAITETHVSVVLVDDMSMVARLLAITRGVTDLLPLNPDMSNNQAITDAITTRTLVRVRTAILTLLGAAIEILVSSSVTITEHSRWIAYQRSKEKVASLADELAALGSINPSTGVTFSIEPIRLADPSLASFKGVKPERHRDLLSWLGGSSPPGFQILSEAETSADAAALIENAAFASWNSASSSSILLVQNAPGRGSVALCSPLINVYRRENTNTSSRARIAYAFCVVFEPEKLCATAEQVMRILAQQLAMSLASEFAVHAAALAIQDRHEQNESQTQQATMSHCIELILAVLEENPATLVVAGLDEVQDPGKLAQALRIIADKSTNVVKIFVTHSRDSVVESLLPSVQMITPSNMKKNEYSALIVNITETGRIPQCELPENLGSSSSKDQASNGDEKQNCADAIASGAVESLQRYSRRSTTADVVPKASVAIAAIHGDAAMVSALLKKGHSIQEECDFGSPLRCASLAGSGGVCRLLIQRGAEVDDGSKFGGALHGAAMRGHLHIVRILLDAGADVNNRGGHYGTPLQAAAFQGEKEVVSVLLDAGADPKIPGFSKDAFHAAAEGEHKEIIQLFLASGFALALPASPGGHACRIAPSPPRNLLQEASPNGREATRSWQRRRVGRSSFDDDHSSSDDESTKDDDWVDLGNPTPRILAYQPLQRQSHEDGFESDDDGPVNRRNRRESNYPLEAAAAHNHLDVLLELLTQHDFLGLDDSSLQHALIAACRNGHARVVEELLSRFEDDNIPLRAALSKAAAHSHVKIVRTLLEHDRAAETRFDRLKATVKASAAAKPHVFHEILEVAKAELSEAEIKDLLMECLPSASKGDRADILDAILRVAAPDDRPKLIDAMIDASKEGKIAAVRALDRMNEITPLRRTVFSKCIRLAVENGRSNVVQYLLPMLHERGKLTSLRNMVIIAAGSGYLDILETLLADKHMNCGHFMQQALNVAAQNGHEEVCQCLLKTGVDPLQSAPNVFWGEVSIDRGLNELELMHGTSESSDSEADNVLPIENKGHRRNAKRNKIRRQESFQAVDGQENMLPLTDHSRAYNAIEMAISGFNRFECRDEWFWIHRNSYWREGNRQKQHSCLALLLQSVNTFADPLWDEAVCAAAKFCPPSIITSMLGKRANAQARFDRKEALYFAASRESLCFPIVKGLFDYGGGRPLSKEELRVVLSRAVSHFAVHAGRPDGQGALFVDTKSLKHVFNTGPGAVIQYLLSSLQEPDISGLKTSALLQCTAAAGLTELFKLLLDCQAKPDELDSYYGTALQAAARFGRYEIVKLLLDAGVSVNVRQGRHHNALRAAVLSGNLVVVNLLIHAGAELEASGSWSYSSDKEDDPTALQLAVQHKASSIALTLIDAGANIDPEREWQQVLFVQACRLGDVPLIERLLAYGTNVQTSGRTVRPWGSTRPEEVSGMHAAIEEGNIQVIELLISRGFQLSADFGNEDPPLTFAARKGNSRIVELLLGVDGSVSNEVIFRSIKGALRCVGHGKVSYAVIEKLILHRPMLLEGERARQILFSCCCQDDPSITELVLEELAYRGQVEAACIAVMNKPPTTESKNLEPLLEYVAITVEFFIQACKQGHHGIVKIGLEQGMDVNVCDTKGCSTIHLAVLGGHLQVVSELLSHGADVNARDPKWGSLIKSALEIHVARRLFSQELPPEARSRAELLTGLSWEKRNIYPYKYNRLGKFTYQQAQDLLQIVQLLIDKGHAMDVEQSPFGSVMSMAAFLGLRTLFDILGDRVVTPCMGGYLQSPLAAAIEASHMDLAKAMVENNATRDIYCRAARGLLHIACEKSNLPAVKLLLRCGIDHRSRNASGDTSLAITLSKLERRNFSRQEHGKPHADVIANILVDIDSSTAFTDAEIVAACKIEDEKVRVPILQKMISRLESTYFPDAGVLALIPRQHYHWMKVENTLQRLLDEKRIERVSLAMLCAVEDVNVFAKLLDYRPTLGAKYEICPESFDCVRHNHGRNKRSIIKLLLNRAEDLMPNETNVLTVLQHTSRSRSRLTETEERDCLDFMFTRNPELKVTEEMLMNAVNANDLDFLLKRTQPGEGVFTAAVFDAFGQKYIVGQSDEILTLLLSFDKTVKLPDVFVTQYVRLVGIKALGQIWDYDQSIVLTEQSLISLLRDHTRGQDGRENSHGNLLKLLDNHRGQWIFGDQARRAPHEKFPEQSDSTLKKRYLDVLEK